MVTEPTDAVVVYAYTVTAEPAEVTESVETPEAIVFGASDVFNADINLTVDEAAKETTVPLSAVAASATE